MKKIFISTIILGTVVLTACNKQASPYEVSKKQYEENCYGEKYIPKIDTLNFTVSVTETIGEDVYTTITKFDKGKVFSSSDLDNFYVQFQSGTYSAENETWSYYYYYEEAGGYERIFIENDSLPDDMYLPDIGFLVGYEDVKYNSETKFYEMIEDSKEISGAVFSNAKVQFLNGKIVKAGFEYYYKSNPTKVYKYNYEIKDYGKTSVTLPEIFI